MRFAFAWPWLATLVVAVRRQRDSDATDDSEALVDNAIISNSDVKAGSASDVFSEIGSGTNIEAGVVLRDRYVLEERIGGGSEPGKKFPKVLKDTFSKAKHWSMDLFTDMWKAHDSRTKEKIMVQLFYNAVSGQHLTWQSANAIEQGLLTAKAKECVLVQKLMQHSEIYVSSSRICQCHSEHISDAVITGRPPFLVLERCGTDLATVLEERARKGRANIVKARGWLKQALEAIAFLEMFNPPFIHHDLKPEEIFIDETALKIAGLGKNVLAVQGAEIGPLAYTAAYAPPEVREQDMTKFAQPVHSYDVYSLGLLYMQMMCAKVNVTMWTDPETDNHLTLDAKGVEQLVLPCAAKLGLVGTIFQDMKLVERMLSQKPADRPAPMEILTTPPLANTNWTAPATVQQFMKGQAVVYYSTTYNKRIEGTIADVRLVQKRYVYDINAFDGMIKDIPADYLMQHGRATLQQGSEYMPQPRSK